MKKFNITQFLLLLLLETYLYSQDNKPGNGLWFLEANYHYGSIMPHLKEIEYLIEGHISAMDIKLGKNTQGVNLWEQMYRFPRIGGGYYLCNYNNPQVLGYVHAAYAFINIPLYKKKETFSFNVEIDFGFSYLTKTFDIDNNFQNIAIGSNGNVFFKTGLDTKIRLTDCFELINGLSFSHCSNGRVKEPNLGINVVGLSAGISCYFNENHPERSISLPTEFIRFNEYSMVASGGWKQWKRHDQNTYIASSLAFNVERHINYLQSIGIGLDIFYDQSLETILEYYHEDKEATQKELYRSGIHVSHNLIYNRLSLVFNTGYYFYTKYVEITSMYSRLGLRYKVSEHILANLTLKSHFAQADFIEWGIGYYWKQNKK